jgi:hypothetical protein
VTSKPVMLIALEVEAAPKVIVSAANSAEADDLRNWIVSNEEKLVEQVVEIIESAELIRERREGSA